MHDSSALVDFELKILEFDPEASVQIMVFDGFFSTMHLKW